MWEDYGSSCAYSQIKPDFKVHLPICRPRTALVEMQISVNKDQENPPQINAAKPSYGRIPMMFIKTAHAHQGHRSFIRERTMASKTSGRLTKAWNDPLRAQIVSEILQKSPNWPGDDHLHLEDHIMENATGLVEECHCSFLKFCLNYSELFVFIAAAMAI